MRHGLRRAFTFSRVFPRFQSLPLFPQPSIYSRFFASKPQAVEKPQQTGIKAAKGRLTETVDEMLESVKADNHPAELEKLLKNVNGTIKTETNEGTKTFVLKISKDKYDVEVRWGPDDVAADDTGEGEQLADEEEKGEDGSEQPEDEENQDQQNTTPPHSLLVFVTPKGKSNKIRLACTATSDYDLRVDGIDVSDEKGEFPEEKMEELGALDFNELDSDVQDAIYDLLHALSIDDSTATIVHHQNWIYKTEGLKRALHRFIEFTNL